MTKPPVQATERRHFDPKGTWIVSILASGAIHGFAFWLLYPFLEGHLEDVYSQNEPIPIDLIVLEPENPSPAPAKTNSATESTPKPPEKIAQSTPKPTVKNSPDTSPPTTATQPQIKPSPTPRQQPQVKPSPTQNTPQPPKPSPTPTPQPTTPVKESPTPSPQIPSSSPSTAPSPVAKPSPSPQPGGRYGVTVKPELRIDGSQDDELGKLAEPITQQQSFNFAEYGLALTNNADQPITLDVVLLIDQTGKPAFKRLQAVKGEINVEVDGLIEVIVNQWQFSPTLNKMGEPFAQTYEVSFTISLLGS
ncbi:MAG: hypothetical protein WA919_22660 [Coleofasciculaceae cyanobacterium]